MPVSPPHVSPALASNASAATRHDAALASEFALRLALGDVILAFQAVQCLPPHGDSWLYYEVLTRIQDESGEASCGALLQAMERLDRIAAYDMLVLHTVIDLLQDYPQVVLGCNLSARSLSLLKLGWTAVFQRLRAQPQIARRLVVEMTETAAPADVEEARFIFSTLQQLGCRIAMDDLGGHGMPWALIQACQPDYIKLDGSLLAGESLSPARCRMVTAAVTLAQTMASMVILEGVDSEEKRLLAQQAGATAVQGFAVAQPQSQPDWLRAPVRVKAEEPQANASPMCRASQQHGPTI